MQKHVTQEQFAEGNRRAKQYIDEKPNENLLINPNFRVNQRGRTGTFSHSSIASENYFIDRWYLKNGSVTVHANGVIVLDGTIIQILEESVGTNVTASASAGIASYDDSKREFSIVGNGDAITWAKLEYGQSATPFVAPSHAEELLKCKMFWGKITGIFPASTKNGDVINVYFPILNKMRITPPSVFIDTQNVNETGGLYVSGADGGCRGDSWTFSVAWHGTIGVIGVAAHHQNHGLFDNIYGIYIGVNHPLIMDAELYPEEA